MTTATKKRSTKKASPARPAVVLSDATKESLKEAKLQRAREIAIRWIESASPAQLEGMMRDAGLGGQEAFLTSPILDAMTKGELTELAAALGVEVAASWAKPKMVAALLEAKDLALPKEFDGLRPRI